MSCFAQVVGGRGFRKPRDPCAQEFLPSLKPLTNEAKRTLAVQTMDLSGYKSLVVNGVVVSPFEEEEEGTGVTSDVVKVKGEDPGLRNRPPQVH